MSTAPSRSIQPEVEYPTGDGKPMAETPVHRKNLTDTIFSLERWYEGEPEVYVSGNMFLYYVEGEPRIHVSPDVFVVLGVPRRERDCYKTWEEPKRNLDFVAEFTSKSTKKEDLKTKYGIYRDELRVREYLLFDPYEEYLDPPEQLFRLVRGDYQRVLPVDGRLPSKVLGLHLERDGEQLRLFDPTARCWLPTPDELAEERDQAIAKLAHSEAEVERLRRELESLKNGPKKKRQP